MPNLPAPPVCVQVCYSTFAGPLLRENGNTRPIGLDEIERRFGSSSLDEVMIKPGVWIDCSPEAAMSRSCDRMTANLSAAARSLEAAMNLLAAAFNMPRPTEPAAIPVTTWPHKPAA